MTIRGILFDKDGTLLDYWKTWVPINRKAALFAAGEDPALAAKLLRGCGHDPETDNVASGSLLAVGSIGEIADAFSTLLGARTPPRLPEEIERIFREGGAQHSVLIDGAAETLRLLKSRGMSLGIATNDSAGGMESSLAPHGLLPLFEFLAGCDSGYGAKPEPGMALAFCDALGLSPDEVAIVGDAAHDLETGKRAGLGLKIGVLTGTSPLEDLAPHADVVLESVVALPGYLAG